MSPCRQAAQADAAPGDSKEVITTAMTATRAHSTALTVSIVKWFQLKYHIMLKGTALTTKITMLVVTWGSCGHAMSRYMHSCLGKLGQRVGLYNDRVPGIAYNVTALLKTLM